MTEILKCLLRPTSGEKFRKGFFSRAQKMMRVGFEQQPCLSPSGFKTALLNARPSCRQTGESKYS